jgi:hypothetical protein
MSNDDKYIYRGPANEPRGEVKAGPELLPEGDYDFKVLKVHPVRKAANSDNLVMPVDLILLHEGAEIPIRYWPWADVSGDVERDRIRDFLEGIGRLPKVGTEPRWSTLPGARGKAKIKVGTFKELARNEVAFVYRPRPLSDLPKVGPKPPEGPDELEMGNEPEDIPF